MWISKIPAVAAWLTAGVLAYAAPAAAHHHDKEAGEIAAGLLGLAVGAAIVDDSERRHEVYGPPVTPYYASPRPFSPHYGVSCFPAQRACYHDEGGFSAHWTHRVYGR